jgi:PhzF family phenazine biosynthesis protein
MKIPIYQADAFTDKLFGGNPAAICLCEDWLTEEQMQHIAAENNLAETAFLVGNGNEYQIRWFTPTVEVDLCGHATLASAHILFQFYGPRDKTIRFHSKSGILAVNKEADGRLTLDFPVSIPQPVGHAPKGLFEGLGTSPLPLFRTAFDFMVVLPSQQLLLGLQPDFKVISQVEARGIICTAPGDSVDFVSRCFFPQSGIDEDPVTGSAHTSLTPYWAGILHKNTLRAIQLSKRRGHLECRLEGDRVLISGFAVTYLQGTIDI